MTLDSARATQINEHLRYADGLPEQAFGLAPPRLHTDGAVTGRMPAERIPTGPDSAPSAGALGVLADDVLGFAMIASSRAAAWSVSVEIAMDFLAPLPTAGGLHICGHGSHVDAIAGYAHGEVRDDQHRLLVVARQHGRFVPVPSTPPEQLPTLDRRSKDVLGLLGATVRRDGEGAIILIGDPRPWLNPKGALHGGMAIAAAEAAATYTTLDSPVPLRTTSLAITFPRPMSGPAPYTFKARPLHVGRTLRLIDVVGYAEDTPRTFVRVVRQSLGIQ